MVLTDSKRAIQHQTNANGNVRDWNDRQAQVTVCVLVGTHVSSSFIRAIWFFMARLAELRYRVERARTF